MKDQLTEADRLLNMEKLQFVIDTLTLHCRSKNLRRESGRVAMVVRCDQGRFRPIKVEDSQAPPLDPSGPVDDVHDRHLAWLLEEVKQRCLEVQAQRKHAEVLVRIIYLDGQMTKDSLVGVQETVDKLVDVRRYYGRWTQDETRWLEQGA